MADSCLSSCAAETGSPLDIGTQASRSPSPPTRLTTAKRSASRSRMKRHCQSSPAEAPPPRKLLPQADLPASPQDRELLLPYRGLSAYRNTLRQIRQKLPRRRSHRRRARLDQVVSPDPSIIRDQWQRLKSLWNERQGPHKDPCARRLLHGRPLRIQRSDVVRKNG